MCPTNLGENRRQIESIIGEIRVTASKALQNMNQFHKSAGRILWCISISAKNPGLTASLEILKAHVTHNYWLRASKNSMNALDLYCNKWLGGIKWKKTSDRR